MKLRTAACRSGNPHRVSRRSGRISLMTMLMLASALALAGGLTFLIPSWRETVFGPPAVVSTGQYILAPVTRGPFRIIITEDGKVDSVRNATLTSRVKGTTTIISIVPEGSLVDPPTVVDFPGVVTWLESPSASERQIRVTREDGEFTDFEIPVGGWTQLLVNDGQKVKAGDFLAGDVVCELDSSKLVESELTQQIKVTEARASLEKADKNLEIQTATNDKVMAAARLAEKLADLDLKKYMEDGGEYDQSVQKIQGDIKQTEEELAIAQEEYDRVRELARKGYTSLYSLEAARVKVTQKKIVLNVQKGELDVLERFTLERTSSELQQMAEDTKTDTLRAQLEGEAAMAQMRADHEAAQLKLAVEEETLDRLTRQIADCLLVAPQAGEVVYATQSSRRSEPIVIEGGAQVRERQAIIKLPNLESMKVDARIHESRIRQVRVGQQVEIEISSLPGLDYHGTVETVASLPVPGEWPNNSQMEFQSEITITDSPDMIAQLKPGMGAELRIIVEERDTPVIQIPVQSVLPVAGLFYTYVMGETGPERRGLSVGKSNDEFMEILDGVAEGEQVILNPRTHFGNEINQLEQELLDSGEGMAPQDRSARSGQSRPAKPKPRNAA